MFRPTRMRCFLLRCSYDKPCLPPLSSGGDWMLLSDEVTDSCYVVKDLSGGASYVFRVACIAKSGTGPFSDSSAPVVMAMHPEGERQR